MTENRLCEITIFAVPEHRLPRLKKWGLNNLEARKNGSKELTARDRGELLTSVPPIRNFELGQRIKRWWIEGRTAKEAAIITGCSLGHCKKFFAAFYRAQKDGKLVEASYSPKKRGRAAKPENTAKNGLNNSNFVQEPIRKKKCRRLIYSWVAPSFPPPIRRIQKRELVAPQNLPDGVRAIPLTGGKFAMVDEKHFIELSRYKWQARKGANTWYAVRTEAKKGILMHRQILGLTDPKVFTDHKDGNGLNNLESNIRPCTQSENQRNMGVGKRNTSGFKGVSWKEKDKRWIAKIKAGGKQIHLGSFKSVLEAAEAYNIAARKYHGDFARLNEF